MHFYITSATCIT